MSSHSRFSTFPRLLLIAACFLYQPLAETGNLTADGPIRKPPVAYSHRFSEEPVSQQTGHKWGFIDKTGQVAMQPLYDVADEFAEGLAAVATGGKVGFIDKNGRIVIPQRYDSALRFSQGLAAVQIGGKWGFIDKTGKMVIP
jgi:hypothetical protein